MKTHKQTKTDKLAEAIRQLPYQFLRDIPPELYRLYVEQDDDPIVLSRFFNGVPVPLTCWKNKIQQRVAQIILKACAVVGRLEHPNLSAGRASDDMDLAHHHSAIIQGHATRALDEKRSLDLIFALRFYLRGWDGAVCLNSVCKTPERLIADGRCERPALFCKACQEGVEAEIRRLRVQHNPRSKVVRPNVQVERTLAFKSHCETIKLAA